MEEQDFKALTCWDNDSNVFSVCGELKKILQEAAQANGVFAAEETVGDCQKVVDKA